MSRYREIPPAEMSPAQQRVRDQIIAGKRGRFGGPFELLIRAPEICGLASQLGEHLRWGTSLPDRLSELAPGAAIEAIRTDGTPLFTAKDEAVVHRICSEIFRTRRLSDEGFNQAVATLGETGLVEVIGIIGYYTLIANTLNVFDVGLPAGEAPPFPE